MMNALAREGESARPRERLTDEGYAMDSDMVVTGAIIDSWVERAGSAMSGLRLVLQVAPSGRPKDLLIVEAEPSLVPDLGWLEDLRANLCHGSPVAAVCRPTRTGLFRATHLKLAR